MLQQIIILTALILGSVNDIKKREVPDSLNYSLIALGLILSTALSIINMHTSFIINSVTGLIIGFGVGALFYYTGQWGGGDAKLIMGIGALMGVNPFTMFNNIPLFIAFLITSLLAGAIYGFVWLIALAIKNRSGFKKEYDELRKNDTYLKLVLVILLCFLLTSIILSFVINISNIIIIAMVLLVVLFLLITYAKNFIKAIENSCLVKKVRISEVTEGDWVLDDFKFKNKKIRADKTGIEQKDLDFLKRKGITHLTIKQGIPFVPSFLIAYIIMLLLGNWFLLI